MTLKVGLRVYMQAVWTLAHERKPDVLISELLLI
jgi:hypothetical protein